ncbi:hypothetical protein ASG43_03365 [Aureimonas sp. Leaf454]|uniref:hypothetical protein n=1 Tax=Aureimonas sp. Leaf454 TaxID=1736381 RepID=UPI0006F71D12|nr:hypothetical protein [Aureimonas sp. Leaf454]KQT54639.1 hypothetical protein ASG43_03365 [Aureimonas sp. Leaf454]
MAVEKDSPTWRAVKAHCEAGIEAARVQLETQGAIEAAQYQRGRIKALREILALADTRPPIESSTRLY